MAAILKRKKDMRADGIAVGLGVLERRTFVASWKSGCHPGTPAPAGMKLPQADVERLISAE